ncbi:MAG: methyltransferase domain-containing protein [Pyrinomonadaceae bacterium]
MTLRDLIFRFGWDTRCRNVDVARVLRPLLGEETTLLDAGCGEYGLTAFMLSAQITGVDILPADTIAKGVNYVHGSIIDIPFEDRFFDIAASVDVLEHLPEDIRPAAVKQLVRVAKNAVVITFPCGERARNIDEYFEKELKDRGQPLPEWLAEHLANRYPEAKEIIDEITTEAESSERKVSTQVIYSENSTVAKILRWSAARSKYLYIAANLLAGILLPIMPKANAANGYRAIVFTKFDS